MTEQVEFHDFNDPVSWSSVDRTITEVTLAEDGWAVEVEDAKGIRLTYWIADPGWAPPTGTIARFYHVDDDRRLCALEIDGQFVFNACHD